MTLWMGQRWKATGVEAIAISEWLPDVADPLFTVDFANNGGGADEKRVVDDGRS